jgi:hypothetical protein
MKNIVHLPIKTVVAKGRDEDAQGEQVCKGGDEQGDEKLERAGQNRTKKK